MHARTNAQGWRLWRSFNVSLDWLQLLDTVPCVLGWLMLLLIQAGCSFPQRAEQPTITFHGLCIRTDRDVIDNIGMYKIRNDPPAANVQLLAHNQSRVTCEQCLSLVFQHLISCFTYCVVRAKVVCLYGFLLGLLNTCSSTLVLKAHSQAPANKLNFWMNQ